MHELYRGIVPSARESRDMHRNILHMFLHHAGARPRARPVKEGPCCGRRHGRGSSHLHEVFVSELFYIHVYAMPEQNFKREAPS